MRVKVLGAVITAALVIGAVAGVPAMAADGSPQAGNPSGTSGPTPDSLSQCSNNTVCVWEGRNFDGSFSWWPASDFGCHNHANNPLLRSIWNRTAYKVRFGGCCDIGPNVAFSLTSGYITGNICWPV